MSIGSKGGRVVHVFGVQLRNRIHWEQFHFCFLLTAVRFYTDLCIYFSELFAMGLGMF
jgi:hypothetical protein